MRVERNGNVWTVTSFSSEDCEVSKDGAIVAVWEAGVYDFKCKLSEQDLGVVTDLVERFKQNISK